MFPRSSECEASSRIWLAGELTGVMGWSWEFGDLFLFLLSGFMETRKLPNVLQFLSLMTDTILRRVL